MLADAPYVRLGHSKGGGAEIIAAWFGRVGFVYFFRFTNAHYLIGDDSSYTYVLVCYLSCCALLCAFSSDIKAMVLAPRHC